MEILAKKIEQKLGVSLVLLFIFSLSIFVVVNSPWLYALSVHYFGLTHVTHLSSGALMRCYRSMVKYLQAVPARRLNLIYFRSSARGRLHFRNVRHLVLANNFILLISGLSAWRYVSSLKRSGRLWLLVIPAKMAIAVWWVLLALVMVDFQNAFVEFHRLFFRNSAWLFTKRTDPVILALPGKYFLVCFLAVFVINMCLLSLVVHVGRIR